MTTAEAPRTAWLALSDERDLHLRLRLEAWRDGYRAAAAAQFEAGYVAAVADVKAAEHALYNHLRKVREVEERRWGPGGRARFGDPRLDDKQPSCRPRKDGAA
jgi:hypothetical protein